MATNRVPTPFFSAWTLMRLDAPAPRGPRPAPVARGAAPSVLRRILAQRQAARERLRRSCLLSVFFQILLLPALLPLSLPALRAQRAATRMEVTRVYLEPPTPVGAVASEHPERPELEPEEVEVAVPVLPPETSPEERERLDYVRAHLDPTVGPVSEMARIATRDQAVAKERHAHARLRAAMGRAVSGEREAADQAASQARAAPPPRREATLPEAARRTEPGAQPPPIPVPETAVAAAPLPKREAWAPFAARVRSPATPERSAPTALDPDLAHAGGPDAAGARPMPPSPARLSSPAEPAPPAVATALEPSPPAEEHVPTFLVDPVALARAERQAQVARQDTAQSEAEGEQAQRDVGSARAAASPSRGALAAAPATLVSVEGPATLDLTTALATRNHPLALALEALDDALRGAWTIPVDVRVSGIVGTTGVAFLIDRRGQISAPYVVHPSGHQRLDTLALAAVPDRVRRFRHLLAGEALEAFPAEGLHIQYRFVYEDSPIGAVR